MAAQGTGVALPLCYLAGCSTEGSGLRPFKAAPGLPAAGKPAHSGN